MILKFPYMEPPPNISIDQWNSWKWQTRESLSELSQFEALFQLSKEERDGFSGSQKYFQIRVTPYYAHLANSDNPKDPIRRIFMPLKAEITKGVQEQLDPLGERSHSPTSRIIHRYPDRVLFLVTDTCGVYCRYCTRKHFTGKHQAFIKNKEYKEALEYIQKRKGLREVILSGGDPLTLGNAPLESVLEDLRSIKHIEVIRIGTRMPVINPMRIDIDLVRLLRKHKPVFLMTHFNHPKELTSQAAEALELFVDHGVPVFNQMVLLNGINNHHIIVQALARRLLYLRVKPYYMFQCDPSRGTDHLRTPIDESLEIQNKLWGNLSGLAMSNLSLDIPSGGGKVSLVPNFTQRQSTHSWDFCGWDGVEATYKNPNREQMFEPIDVKDYEDEWNALRMECPPNGRGGLRT